MSVRNIFKLAILSSALMVSTGCASTVGKEFDATAVEKVKIGHTTTKQTMAALGEPYSRNVAADGTEYWQYLFIEGKGKVSAHSFIPYVGLFTKDNVKTKTTQQMLDLRFKDNLLTECTMKFVESSETSGGFMGQQSTGNSTSREVACGE